MRNNGLPTIIVLVLVVGGFVFLLWRNTQANPTTNSQPIGIPTQATATDSANPMTVLLREGFASTALPTVAIPTLLPTQPQVVLQLSPTGTLVGASDLSSGATPVLTIGDQPTLPPPTPTRAEEGVQVTVQSVTREAVAYQPPPLIPPLSRDPLGRDHYWLMRPIDSNAQNWVLSVYPFGSDGNDNTNPLRVHHGIDMPNPVGEIVRAAGSGEVIWSADGRQGETDIFQNSPSYGNVIVIAHDFGYNGKKIWTLYAHLSASFVQVGQYVQAGEPIGQVGQSGRVTGPHVHFEVRVGDTDDDNRYANTYNPVLWMVPYVGHGVIAGVVKDANGNIIMDADVTIRNFATGLTEATTTSYVMLDSGSDVKSDPIWQENFAVPDISVGKYDVIVTINGERVIRQVTVVEGTTAFVEIKPLPPNTSTPVPTELPNIPTLTVTVVESGG
jgi:murein DD-endopeptidase MepM/ murein hydrolase activator NlpD